MACGLSSRVVWPLNPLASQPDGLRLFLRVVWPLKPLTQRPVFAAHARIGLVGSSTERNTPMAARSPEG